MAFTDRLARLRRAKGITQKDLASSVGLNQAQIHRYEKGLAEPSMSALKRLAVALGVTIDELVFEEGERGPDDDLRLQFDAISQFGTEEKKAAKDLLDALILKHQARRWTGTER
jgi:transcriptional regulator with XRE-family HTH domain